MAFKNNKGHTMKPLKSLGLATCCLWHSFSYSQNILIVESYTQDYRWDAQYIQAIKDKLGQQHSISVMALDTKRLDKTLWEEKAMNIMAKIANNKPDVVILGDDNAMSLMAEKMVTKDIPVVFLGVNGTAVQHPILNHPLVTGILERPFFAQSIRHLRKVLKKRDRFLILMDDSPTMQNAVNEYFGESRQSTLYGSQLNIMLTNDKARWIQSIIEAEDNYDAIIIGTHHTIRDEAGNYVTPNELMQLAFKESSIPIFSFWDIFIGEQQGAGGFTVSAYHEGTSAARLASMILSGIPPDRIPKLKSLSGQFVYSKSGLSHWNLTLSALTASQVEFVD